MMEFDTRSIERIASENPMTNDDMPSDFFDTFTAAKNMALAADNSNSRWNYLNKSREEAVSKMIESDPANASLYQTYGDMSPGYVNIYKALDESGRINEISDIQLPYKAAWKAAKSKIAELGLDDIETSEKKARLKAYEDYAKASKVVEKGGLLPEILGGMYGAMHDPINLMLLPFGAEASATGVIARAGQRFAQEAAIAAVAEVPIQTESYQWKNDIGLDFDIKDSFATGALSVAAAGIIGAAGGAFFDVVVPAKPKTADEIYAANLMANRTIENPDEHVMAMNMARAQMEFEGKVDIGDTKLSDAPDISAEVRNINDIEQSKIYDANDFDDDTLAWIDQNRDKIDGIDQIESDEAGIRRIMECAI